ncbi:helix-turn-helix domain-containing protein [Nocardioides sp.]|uniref:helix-turn-helix domain-containing protein n=1 Tax=Nocardioides sp. TaxID=35761 RepID=UPI0039E3FD06
MPTPRSYLSQSEIDERARRRTAFGARIRALRQEAGLTQEKLALAAGLDRPFLVQIEGGKRSMLVERLPDLARALGVPVADLFPADL